jgi:hypothetical protein
MNFFLAPNLRCHFRAQQRTRDCEDVFGVNLTVTFEQNSSLEEIPVVLATWHVEPDAVERPGQRVVATFFTESQRIARIAVLVESRSITASFGQRYLGELYLLALPLAFHALIYEQMLTVRGACVVVNDQAFLIVGESGAGKSTAALAIKACWLDAVIVGDDHVMIRATSTGVSLLTPIWDSMAENAIQHCIEVAHLSVFSLFDEKVGTDFGLQGQWTLLYGLDSLSTAAILSILEDDRLAFPTWWMPRRSSNAVIDAVRRTLNTGPA